MEEHRSPGQPWTKHDVELYGRKLEEGGGVSFGAIDGPYKGEVLRLPHIEWVRWVYLGADGDLASVAHPPGWILPTNASRGTLLGYYRFVPREEMLKWAPAEAFDHQ